MHGIPRMHRTPRPRLRGPAAVLAAVALLGGVLTTGATAQAAPRPAGQLTDLVDPFIGTQNEGNTYPGASVPFGMVQLSPDTGHNTGYDYAENHIRGFSAVHLSGVGCGLGGDLPTLPTTGTSRRPTTPSTQRSSATTTRRQAPATTRSG